MMRRYALSTLVFLSLLAVTGARELGPEEREALAQVDAIQNSTWARCPDAQGAKHLIVRVVPQPVPENPFTPLLSPLGTPQVGYYDLLLYRIENGQYNIGFEQGTQQLTVADKQNGIQARYVVRLFVPAYRVYDPRIGGWTPWDSGKLWEKEKINFANYTVTTPNGAWKTDVHYNIMTNGQFEMPKCSDVLM